MEAKDTVIRGEILHETYPINDEKGHLKVVCVVKCPACVLDRQAEISFKAGTKEVVDWVEEGHPVEHIQIDWNCLQAPDRFADMRRVYEEDWQEQKKEWGL